MAGNIFFKDVLPFAAMVAVECLYVGLHTLFKAATRRGMSYLVFIVYSNAVAALVLLPLCLIFQRKELPTFKLPLLYRIILLGLLGFSSQLLGSKGLDSSSPTLASATSNLTPAFTFTLAIIFRNEKLALRSSSTKAKIIGTTLSISGALVVVLYKGPELLSPSTDLLHWSLSLPQSNWIFGGILLTIQCFVVSVCYIIQAQVMKMYPAEIAVVFFCNFCALIVSAPVCFIIEKDPSAWRIQLDTALITIIYSGCLGTCFCIVIHTWALHLKGPFYVSIFKPLSIAIAVAMATIFLGDALHLGSVVGAIILTVGFYAVLWGKNEEEKQVMEASQDQKFPLLGSQLNA